MFHVEHCMEEGEKLELLKKGAQGLGIALNEAQAGSFLIYLRELKTWNRKMNLTSIEGEKDIIIKHFLDSLTPLRFLSGVKSVLDMGAGAGFPGIPLKIVLPDIQVTLLDSVEKKVNFLRHIIRTLRLKGIEAVSGRAESPELVQRLSGSFDCVISRAFAGLEAFITLGLPYLKTGGVLLAMKGPAVSEELRALGEIKGASLPEAFDVPVPLSDRVTTLVVIRKL